MGTIRSMRATLSLQSLGRRIRIESRGSTIVEFAFVAGPFFALLLAILQTSLIFFADQTLETAAQSVSRLVMTGQVQSNTTTSMSKTAFKAAACSKLPTFMDCNNLTVDVSVAGNGVDAFAGADVSQPVVTYSSGVPVLPNRYNTGSKNDIVIVRLTYPWNVVGASGLNLASMANGQYLLVATTITQTEPYQCSPTPCS